MELHASSLALAVALGTLAAAPPPSPDPVATETSGPALQIPEIGRTRATSPACAAMRDLVIPSFAATQRADARFVETRKRFPQYVDIMDDKENSTSVFRQMVIAKLDADASALLREALVLNRALGDPRLAADSKDPQVLTERAQLQQLYEMQSARANLLTEYVTRERIATATHGMEDNGALRGRLAPAARIPDIPTGPALPATTAAPGMPLLTGNALADKEALAGWGTSIARAVRASENQAAKAFIAVAQQCR
jgi:hypothetical protein